jgi:DeoR/GlpR family transcriptional regulator of sugar metabolism
VHFSKAFIGIDGWQAETGFTGRDMMRADVVNAVLEKGCEAIVLSDSSKFSVVHPYPLGPGALTALPTNNRTMPCATS